MLQTDQPRQTLQIPLVHLREIVRKKGLYRMWYEKSIQFFKFVHIRSHTPLTRQHLEVTSFKPRANGCNIVGQQLPTLLDVTCCVRLHTQCIVGSCCIRLHTTANKQATIPNIVCANNVGNCCVRLHAALGFCESLTGIKETLTLSSPCSTFSQALSLNSFAWTTWPETLQPREIMMPRDKGNVDQGANEGQGPQYHK